MTVLENVMVGRHRHERTGILADLLHWPSVARQNKATRDAARAALDRVGLADAAERPAGSLAYGALKRLEIARALASEPKIAAARRAGRRLQSGRDAGTRSASSARS